MLRDEGLLEFRRGHGISVAGTPERGAVIARARELIDFARLQGYRLDELVKIIEEARLACASPIYACRTRRRLGSSARSEINRSTSRAPWQRRLAVAQPRPVGVCSAGAVPKPPLKLSGREPLRAKRCTRYAHEGGTMVDGHGLRIELAILSRHGRAARLQVDVRRRSSRLDSRVHPRSRARATSANLVQARLTLVTRGRPGLVRYGHRRRGRVPRLGGRLLHVLGQHQALRNLMQLRHASARSSPRSRPA